jgi:uncharacterized membrane protein
MKIVAVSRSEPVGRKPVDTLDPLNSIPAGIIAGVILAMLVVVIVPGSGFNEFALTRWLHILSGVMWVGLLYYGVVAQIPALAAAAADNGGPAGAAITQYVAPRVLLWFRWAAVATWLTGAWYLWRAGTFDDAFMLRDGFRVIGVSAWLGTTMLFNVWVLIWPSQKKVLGLKPATDEHKAAARKTTLYATRANFILSVPLVLCMAGATHGLPF